MLFLLLLLYCNCLYIVDSYQGSRSIRSTDLIWLGPPNLTQYWTAIYTGRNFITQHFWLLNVTKSAILSASCKFFHKQNHFFSPCSHKIYPLSTNLMESSALRTFSMGVYQTPKIWCFLLFSKIKHPCCRYISAYKKATVMVFI